MPTARDIVSLVLKEVGISGVGQTPLPEDINDVFTLLTRMLSQWEKRRWLVPNQIVLNKLGTGAISLTVGPGGDFSCAARPNDISTAYVIQENIGSTPVSIPLTKIFSRDSYNAITVKSLNTLPGSFFYDNAFPLGNVFFWPIPSALYRLYITVKNALGFSCGVASGSINFGGAAYTNGIYNDILLTGGSGEGVSAQITVTAGAVAIVTLGASQGDGYAVGDILSVSAADIGGTGAGFLYRVDSVVPTLDSEFNLPLEYEEAIHYNLAIRGAAMYQREVSKAQMQLAKASLNTIRNSNLQIPTMNMPSSIMGGRRGFNIYNPDGLGYG